jgi:WD40 repeat protein
VSALPRGLIGPLGFISPFSQTPVPGYVDRLGRPPLVDIDPAGRAPSRPCLQTRRVAVHRRRTAKSMHLRRHAGLKKSILEVGQTPDTVRIFPGQTPAEATAELDGRAARRRGAADLAVFPPPLSPECDGRTPISPRRMLPVLWTARTPHPVHSLQFHRRERGLLAAATCANFGFYPTAGVGGRLVLASLHGQSGCDTSAAPYDLEWAPGQPDVLLSCFNDGTVAAYGASIPSHRPGILAGDGGLRLLSTFRSHACDVSGISASVVDGSKVAACAWDGTVHLLSLPTEGRWSCLRKLCPARPHSPAPDRQELHAVCFSPDSPFLVATAGADGDSFVLDVRSPSDNPSAAVLSHDSECLDVHWSRHGGASLLAVGDAHGRVTMWDSRNCRAPLSVTQVHSWGVRRVRMAPFGGTLSRGGHSSLLILSASFDMTSVLTRCPIRASPAVRPQLLHQTRHSEFVTSVDWDVAGSLIASGGWDRTIVVTSLARESLRSRL